MAVGAFGDPLAARVSIFDEGGAVGDTLFAGGLHGGGAGGVVAAEGFREGVVQLVGPAAVMFGCDR